MPELLLEWSACGTVLEPLLDLIDCSVADGYTFPAVEKDGLGFEWIDSVTNEQYHTA